MSYLIDMFRILTIVTITWPWLLICRNLMQLYEHFRHVWSW